VPKQTTVQLVTVCSDALWDALLEAQPDATLYHTMGWLRLQERHGAFSLNPLVIMQNGQPVGLFPIFTERRWPFRVCSSPRGVDNIFQGPLVPPDLLPAALEAYEVWAQKHGADYTAISFVKEIDTHVARARGYTCERHKTHLVDLVGGEDAVLRACHKDCREAIRKATRRGVHIVEGDLRPYVDLCLHLSAQVYAKSGMPTPLTRGLFLGLLDTLEQSGRLLSLRAEVDGQPVGFYVAGCYRTTLYAIDTASDYAFARYAANTLMNWHILQWGCRHGMRVYDLQGANTPSIAAYKASFGGQVSDYANIKKAHTFRAAAAIWARAKAADWTASLVARWRPAGRSQSQA